MREFTPDNARGRRKMTESRAEESIKARDMKSDFEDEGASEKLDGFFKLPSS